MICLRLVLQTSKWFAFEPSYFAKSLKSLLTTSLQETLHPFSFFYVHFEFLIINWLENCIGFLSCQCSFEGGSTWFSLHLWIIFRFVLSLVIMISWRLVRNFIIELSDCDYWFIWRLMFFLVRTWGFTFST